VPNFGSLFSFMKALILLLVICSSGRAMAQTRNIQSDGNWGDPSIWLGGAIATTIGEDVLMNNGVSVSVNNGQSFNVGNLTALNNNIITVNAGGTLILGDAANLKLLSGGNNTTITVAGTLIVYGDLDVINNLTITETGSGVVRVIGNVNMNNNGSLIVNGEFRVDGNFTGGNNTDVNVNGLVSVGGTTSVGNGSTLTGTGQFVTHGACSSPGSTFCSSGPLPLSLVSFSTVVDNGTVSVKWVTESEINLDYFTVQRSIDAREFTTIGMIKAVGSNASRNNYSLIDYQPVLGKSYYRLKETDLDGKITYFKIHALDYSADQAVQFYPNPVTRGLLNLRAGLDTSGGYMITVFDMSGRQLRQFIDSRAEIEMNLDVAAGLYLVRFDSPSQHMISKIIVK
jgi:hypothetical protein